MLFLISHVLHQPVIDFHTGEVCAVVESPLLEVETGKLLAYRCKFGFFGLQHGYLPEPDVVGYDHHRVVSRQREFVTDLTEEPKLLKAASTDIKVFKASVITRGGQKLGKANDLLIDSETGRVVKYYVHGLTEDRIINASQVIEITKRGILVEDLALDGSDKPVAEPAEVELVAESLS